MAARTSVLLDIGGDVGALVLTVPDRYLGREIEVSPVGDDARRTHTAVLERRVAGRTLCAAVDPGLRAGGWRGLGGRGGRARPVPLEGAGGGRAGRGGGPGGRPAA